MFFDANALLAWLGHWAILGIFLVMFVETGLLVGFLLPGDSLLLTAGLASAVGTGAARLSLPWVILAASGGALLGAQTGYLIGRRAGRALLARSRGRHLGAAFTRTERLLARVGLRRALVVARFVPVVRTVMGPTAGAIGVSGRFFLLWQSVGGLLWTVGTTLLAYVLGRTVPGVEHLIDPAITITALTMPVTLLFRLVYDRVAVHRSRRAAASRARLASPETAAPASSTAGVPVPGAAPADSGRAADTAETGPTAAARAECAQCAPAPSRAASAWTDARPAGPDRAGCRVDITGFGAGHFGAGVR